ncbi:MAG TPA: C4-dicarboxylate ABC transporter, partial [Rubrivivax sp.]|nr:C4-dicarboxylate ABC transporter [Rubrivivax sp.]
GRKSAEERGNVIHVFTPAEREQFIKLSSSVDDEWVADMDKRGYNGKALLASAKSLIARNA